MGLSPLSKAAPSPTAAPSSKASPPLTGVPSSGPNTMRAPGNRPNSLPSELTPRSPALQSAFSQGSESPAKSASQRAHLNGKKGGVFFGENFDTAPRGTDKKGAPGTPDGASPGDKKNSSLDSPGKNKVNNRADPMQKKDQLETELGKKSGNGIEHDETHSSVAQPAKKKFGENLLKALGNLFAKPTENLGKRIDERLDKLIKPMKPYLDGAKTAANVVARPVKGLILGIAAVGKALARPAELMAKVGVLAAKFAVKVAWKLTKMGMQVGAVTAAKAVDQVGQAYIPGMEQMHAEVEREAFKNNSGGSSLPSAGPAKGDSDQTAKESVIRAAITEKK